MGAGASYFDKTSQLTLTHEQRRKYKALFEELSAQGLPPEEIRAQIQLAYDNDRDLAGLGAAGSVVANGKGNNGTNSARRPSLDRLPVTGVEKTSSGKIVPTAYSARNTNNNNTSSAGQSSQTVRRRTFDASPSEPTFVRGRDLKKMSEKEAVSAKKKRDTDVAAALLKSPSESHILTSEAVSFLNDVKRKLTMDSLDIGAAPVVCEADKAFHCDLCRITCKSAAALEQHIKYSYVHSKAEKEAANVADIVERATRLATVLHRCVETLKFGPRKTRTVAKGKSRAWMRWQWAYRMVKFENNVLKSTNYLAQHLARKRADVSMNTTLENSTMTSARGTASLTSLTLPNGPPLKLSSHALLFDGNKFFWKGHETMDIHMFLHNRLVDANGDSVVAPSDGAGKVASGSGKNSARSSGKESRYLLDGTEWTPQSILEIVAFDGQKHVELNRLYVNFSELYRINEDETKAEISKMLAEQAKKQKEDRILNTYMGESISRPSTRDKAHQKSATVKNQHGGKHHHHRSRKDIAHLRANREVDVAVIADFVLSKLELVNCGSDENTADGNGTKCTQKLVLTSADGVIRSNTSTASFLLSDAVIDNDTAATLLSPVNIHRRRKSTEAEIHSVMNSFRNNAENLKALTRAANYAIGIENSPVGRLPKNTDTSKAVESNLSIKMAVLEQSQGGAGGRPLIPRAHSKDRDLDAEGLSGGSSVFADRWDDEPGSGSDEDGYEESEVLEMME
jgi:hypothetical protein